MTLLMSWKTGNYTKMNLKKSRTNRICSTKTKLMFLVLKLR